MRERLRSIGGYCYLWLMVGFFTGTLLLVGPVRILTTSLQSRGWSDQAENVVMIAVIAVYVIASAAIAWWLFRRVTSCRTRGTRLAIPVSVTLAAVACLWAWMNPTLLAGVAGGVGGEIHLSGGPQFVFGPYPDSQRLAQLKQEGVTAVVSLQHPAVVPFEPQGIAEEQRETQQLGITFIHAPMLPWVSANEASLETVRRLAHGGRGKYYVHCGLGRDRVNVVKRLLEREGTHVAEAEGFEKPRTFADRRADNTGPLERGDFTEIDKDLWLIPYPNEHELFGNMLSGQVQHVVLLLDASDATERGWLDEATGLFKEHGVSYSIDPLPARDLAHARAIAARVRTFARPVVVVVPFTAPRGPTDVADTFLEGFGKARSNRSVGESNERSQ